MGSGLLVPRAQQMTGAAVQTYLLEKTRVACQASSERNFHIFYQVRARWGPQLPRCRARMGLPLLPAHLPPNASCLPLFLAFSDAATYSYKLCNTASHWSLVPRWFWHDGVFNTLNQTKGTEDSP